MTDENDDYKVGYCRPPKHTRFKPSQSGNTEGRRKGVKNLKTDLMEELAQPIMLREGDRQVRITKQRAMVKSLMAKAIKGDPRAIAKACELLLQFIGADEESRGMAQLSADDEAILADFLARCKDEQK